MKKVYLFVVLLAIGCQNVSDPQKSADVPIALQEKKTFRAGSVYADNQFDAARLNDFQQINDSTYLATFHPENRPINRSPWFAFRIWSDSPKEVYIHLKYSEHGHRYVPKISRDGDHWTSIDPTIYEVDTSQQTASLKLQLTPQKLWIAAQEVLSVQHNNQWLDTLAQLPYAHKKTIGKSVLGKPIYSLEINEGTAEKTLVLIGRQHPPEIPGGTLSLQAFVAELLADTKIAQQFRKRFEILLIPLLNPDGVDMGHWRHNANGKDLNRDWQDFSQPETQAVREYLKKDSERGKRAYCFAIDFHTSHSGPYLLILDSLNAAKTPDVISDWIQKIEQAIPGYDLDGRRRSQELPYCYNWFFNEFGIEAVTFEEGDEVDRGQIKKRAEVYASKLIESLSFAIN